MRSSRHNDEHSSGAGLHRLNWLRPREELHVRTALSAIPVRHRSSTSCQRGPAWQPTNTHIAPAVQALIYGLNISAANRHQHRGTSKNRRFHPPRKSDSKLLDSERGMLVCGDGSLRIVPVEAEGGADQGRASHERCDAQEFGGRKPWDEVMIFKALVLQALYMY
jgi:hypothetical protein